MKDYVVSNEGKKRLFDFPVAVHQMVLFVGLGSSRGVLFVATLMGLYSYVRVNEGPCSFK